MTRALPAILLLCLSSPAHAAPRFDASGQLLPPTDYRTWVFLTSGFSMAYGPAAEAMIRSGTKAMDNVFVTREAYDAFLRTAVWPEGTMFVLEIRAGEGTGSIVTTGHFQTDLVGLESAVKDSARFPGGWGYFAFQTDASGASGPAKPLPRTAPCYGCHSEHAAVENTFTQFYPTLFPVARAKGKVREDFIGIPASAAELVDTVSAHGWPAGEKLLTETAASWPAANLLREPTLNAAGYRLLAVGKRAEAISVFEYLTRKAPGSANAWDSLSEAYEGANRPADALAAVTRGLAALPEDKAVAPAQRANLEKALTERRARLRAKK